MRARLPLLLSLAVLLLLAVLATRGGSAVPHGKGLVLIGGMGGAGAQPGDVTAARLPGRLNPVVSVGMTTVIAIALVLYLASMVVLVILIASLRVRRRRLALERLATAEETTGGVDGEAAQTLLRGTRSALRLLRQRTGGPPSDAVQEAWLALEGAAAESGTPRSPDQTPTEFTGAVLAAHDVDATAVGTLRGLYQRARFGRPDTVTEADADTAVAALDRIEASLAALR